MWRLLVVCAAVCTTACSLSTTPPTPPAPRVAMPVSASFGKTWDAVVALFAERNIPIRTVDRSSGLIVAETQVIARSAWSETLADCGATVTGSHYRATAANWNVLVRGDSATSTVKATVRFTAGSPTAPTVANVECSSLGSWETALEGQVKNAAEGKTASR